MCRKHEVTIHQQRRGVSTYIFRCVQKHYFIATTWMNHKTTMLSEGIQVQKTIYLMIQFIGND